MTWTVPTSQPSLRYGRRREQCRAIANVSALNAAIYAAGLSLGGLITIPAMSEAPLDETVLWDVVITDLNKQNTALDLLIFDANPSGSTFTDHVAADIVAADLPKLVDVVSIIAGNWSSLATPGIAATRNLEVPIIPEDGNVYVAPICRGTPTFANAAALQIKFLFLRSLAFS